MSGFALGAKRFNSYSSRLFERSGLRARSELRGGPSAKPLIAGLPAKPDASSRGMAHPHADLLARSGRAEPYESLRSVRRRASSASGLPAGRPSAAADAMHFRPASRRPTCAHIHSTSHGGLPFSTKHRRVSLCRLPHGGKGRLRTSPWARPPKATLGDGAGDLRDQLLPDGGPVLGQLAHDAAVLAQYHQATGCGGKGSSSPRGPRSGARPTARPSRRPERAWRGRAMPGLVVGAFPAGLCSSSVTGSRFTTLAPGSGSASLFVRERGLRFFHDLAVHAPQPPSMYCSPRPRAGTIAATPFARRTGSGMGAFRPRDLGALHVRERRPLGHAATCTPARRRRPARPSLPDRPVAAPAWPRRSRLAMEAIYLQHANVTSLANTNTPALSQQMKLKPGASPTQTEVPSKWMLTVVSGQWANGQRWSCH